MRSIGRRSRVRYACPCSLFCIGSLLTIIPWLDMLLPNLFRACRSALTRSYDSRDATVGAGFTVCGEHFEVHRFHGDLIYGRRGDAEDGEGIALCRTQAQVRL